MPPSDNREDPRPSPGTSALRQEAIGWLARLSDLDASPEDRRAFEQWQAQSPAHARAFQKVAGIWGDPQLDQAARQVVQADDIERHKQAVTRFRRRPWLAAAACLAALLVGSVYFDVLTRLQADQRTAAGERRTVRLPDQSLVTLNTQSAIAVSFDGAMRRVRLLKGEAFFKVQHDPARPFIVEGAETSTRAVGTEFVVRHRSDSDRVTVIEGIVEVSSHGDGALKERLVAGNMIESDRGRLGSVMPTDVSMASAWLQGLLIVDDVPLAQVLDELRRYYPGTLVLLNQSIGERHVTGTYKLDEPSKILYHLTKTFPLRTVSLTDRFVILF